MLWNVFGFNVSIRVYRNVDYFEKNKIQIPTNQNNNNYIPIIWEFDSHIMICYVLIIRQTSICKFEISCAISNHVRQKD